jgi:hypothetical protein
MTQASTTLIHRYSGVAIVVAVISGFGTFTATRFVTASSAQPAPAAAKPLLVQALGRNQQDLRRRLAVVRSKEHSDSNKYLRLAARRRMRCIQCLKFLWCQC